MIVQTMYISASLELWAAEIVSVALTFLVLFFRGGPVVAILENCALMVAEYCRAS
jgi:hypothetical protein